VYGRVSAKSAANCPDEAQPLGADERDTRRDECRSWGGAGLPIAPLTGAGAKKRLIRHALAEPLRTSAFGDCQ